MSNDQFFEFKPGFSDLPNALVGDANHVEVASELLLRPLGHGRDGLGGASNLGQVSEVAADLHQVLSSGLQQEGQEEERNQARAGESLVCYLTVPSALQKLGISR